MRQTTSNDSQDYSSTIVITQDGFPIYFMTVSTISRIRIDSQVRFIVTAIDQSSN